MRRDILVILAVSLALMAPSLVFGPLAIDSALLNHVWTQGFAAALGEGQAYPRWLAGSFEGLGAPTFYFYPPLAFYLSGGFDLAGLSTPQAINAAATLALAASGLTMYGWLRWRGGPALAGALLYLVAPYHLVDWYIRAALAEFTGFLWLPLIAWGIEAWPRRWAPPLLAVSYAGLCLTHLPLALLATVGLVLPMVAWKTGFGRDWRRLGGYAFAGLAALAMAAIYLLPALTLQQYISADLLRADFYRPENWSPFATHDRVDAAAFGWPAPIAAASITLALGSAMVGWRAGRREAAVWGATTAACAVAGLALIPGLWSLPLLSAVQFPWRIFAVMELAAIAAFASAGARPGIISWASAIGAGAVWFRIGVIFVLTLQTYRLPPDADQRLPDAPEYLPAGFPTAGLDEFNREPDLTAFRGPFAEGPVTAAVAGAGGRAELLVTLPGRVTLRRFAFPAWRVTRDGEAVETTPWGPGRLISFRAMPGRYRLERVPLPVEAQGLGLSLVGLLLAALSPLCVSRSRKLKN